MTLDELEAKLQAESGDEDDDRGGWDPEDDLWESLDLLRQAHDSLKLLLHKNRTHNFLSKPQRKEILELEAEVMTFLDGYEFANGNKE